MDATPNVTEVETVDAATEAEAVAAIEAPVVAGRADPPGPQPGQALPADPGHPVQEAGRRGQGRRRDLLRPLPGRDARHRGRVRLWQVHGRQAPDDAGAGDRRRGLLQGPGHHQAVRPRAEGRPPQHPDGVPGPVHLAEPADDGRRHHRGALRDPPRGGAQGRPAPQGAGPPGRRGSQPGVHQPLPAPVLRRSAPAHRHRPRPRAQPGDHHLRRAGLRARRVGAGAGHQPDGEAAGRVQPLLHLHRARPVDRPAHLGPGRRHVPRQDGRDRHGHADLRPPDAPLHPGAAVGGPGPGPGGPRGPRADHPHR